MVTFVGPFIVVAVVACGLLARQQRGWRAHRDRVRAAVTNGVAELPPPGLASAVEATRRDEDRRRRAYHWTWIVSLAAFIGFVVAANLDENHVDRLANGGRVTGTVIRVTNPHLTNSGASVDVSYLVGDQIYHGRVALTDDSANYFPGESVTVEYNKSAPTDMTIKGEDNEPEWAVQSTIILLVGSLFGFGFAIVMARRSRARRHVLGRSSWRVAWLGRVEKTSVSGMVEIDGVMLHVSGYRPWLSATFAPPAPVWLATDGHQVVFAQIDGTSCCLASALKGEALPPAWIAARTSEPLPG